MANQSFCPFEKWRLEGFNVDLREGNSSLVARSAAELLLAMVPVAQGVI